MHASSYPGMALPGLAKQECKLQCCNNLTLTRLIGIRELLQAAHFTRAINIPSPGNTTMWNAK